MDNDNRHLELLDLAIVDSGLRQHGADSDAGLFGKSATKTAFFFYLCGWPPASSQSPLDDLHDFKL